MEGLFCSKNTSLLHLLKFIYHSSAMNSLPICMNHFTSQDWPSDKLAHSFNQSRVSLPLVLYMKKKCYRIPMQPLPSPSKDSLPLHSYSYLPLTFSVLHRCTSALLQTGTTQYSTLCCIYISLHHLECAATPRVHS